MAKLNSKKGSVSNGAPKGNVLLVSCMDLRLVDDIVEFMNDGNLCNRYDHLIFAGAALGALGAPGGEDENGTPNECPNWHETFKDHLGAAVKLHAVKDVYILEHRDCGAYTKVFHIYDPVEGDDVELNWHAHYADELEAFLTQWGKDNQWPLNVHKFLMDLRGDVSVLPSAAKKKRTAKQERKKRKGSKAS